ncbi:MAG: hypothetical protein NZ953_00125 [Thaumarchaeota archaeon]|nr:hypothetical protein [Candidatus Calditenuaceae archaeon]MDW8042965.1 hypothetical protein [Nitrososphaerota archaeon]
MARYRVLLFVQGKGWVPGGERAGVPECFREREAAVDYAAWLIVSAARSSQWPYGSRAGDFVAFKVVEEEGECSAEDMKAPETFSELRHHFFRRGEVYSLYKSWSWPD